MRLFMETTKISPEQTVAQIQRILGKYGVSAIQTEYEGGKVKTVFFKIKIGDYHIPFRLPCRSEVIYRVLIGRMKKIREKRIDEYREQAERIAWRQILRWVEAQMALVETGMVKIQEVFMPYIQTNAEGQTLYEKLEQGKFNLIEHKK